MMAFFLPWGFIWIGFMFAQTSGNAQRFLRAVLPLIAVCAGLWYGLRITGSAYAAGWPMGLVFLFGFCWYMDAWLSAEGLALKSLVPLLACSMPTVATLHKPIIWSAFFIVVWLML
ncbi:MAG: hypothetical protein NTU41_10250, partial [Chloroflexi bacterium]|nr:hypothetical protein [Chloroflexota bacterium]